MAYLIDMSDAAERHYRDGRKLLVDNCVDNAGYHFGLAAECAIKSILQNAGVRDDDSAMWQHFPDLKPTALQSIHGRSAAPVRQLLERDNFMQRWTISMRYAKTGSIDRLTAERWRDHADEAIGLLI